MHRRSRVNQIMYDIKLKEEWKRRLERENKGKERKEVKNGKVKN